MLPIIPFNSTSSTSRGARTTPSQRRLSARRSARRCRHSCSDDAGLPPTRTPICARKRILALAPSIHQRQAVTNMLCMRGNRGTCWRGCRCLRGRQLLERPEQPFVAGVQHIAALLRRTLDQLRKQRPERPAISCVFISPVALPGGTVNPPRSGCSSRTPDSRCPRTFRPDRWRCAPASADRDSPRSPAEIPRTTRSRRCR